MARAMHLKFHRSIINRTCRPKAAMRPHLALHLSLLLLLGLTAQADMRASGTKATFSRGCSFLAQVLPSVTFYSGPGRLARITAYWPGEDYCTTRHRSATGFRLRVGYCAVDSSIIPYGSIVNIFGLGKYLAMDTGSAVIDRQAARESGHSDEERDALVVDLFFPSRRSGERFAREGPKFALVTWLPGENLARE